MFIWELVKLKIIVLYFILFYINFIIIIIYFVQLKSLFGNSLN